MTTDTYTAESLAGCRLADVAHLMTNMSLERGTLYRQRDALLQTLEHAVQMLERISRGESYPALDYLTRVSEYRALLDNILSNTRL